MLAKAVSCEKFTMSKIAAALHGVSTAQLSNDEMSKDSVIAQLLLAQRIDSYGVVMAHEMFLSLAISERVGCFSSNGIDQDEIASLRNLDRGMHKILRGVGERAKV